MVSEKMFGTDQPITLDLMKKRQVEIDRKKDVQVEKLSRMREGLLAFPEQSDDSIRHFSMLGKGILLYQGIRKALKWFKHFRRLFGKKNRRK